MNSKGADPQITGAGAQDGAMLTVETTKTAAFSVTATDDDGTLA